MKVEIGGKTVKGAFYARNISPGVKRAFKATVAREGENMNAVIEALMWLYSKKPKLVDKTLEKVRRKSDG